MKTRVKKMIAKQCGFNISVVIDCAVLLDDLGMDSLDIIELVLMFEEDFGIVISDDDAETWKTVSDVIHYLRGKTS